ncbi:MAG: hypothetical protein EXR71_01635 [Myxococcales bacterium]|nr:hypothetical protein [Myxococcales bacterium]
MTAAEAADPAPVDVGRVTVRADRLSWLAGRFEADGNVIVEVGTDLLRARSATGTAELLTVEDGVWERPSGSITFATAEVRLRARSGILTSAHVEAGEITVDAAQLTADATGNLLASDARLTPCRCPDGERPALSFHAREIEVLGAEVAIVRDGSVRLFDVPILPVPWWREPLDPRRFRPLFPELGYGADGWNARWRARVGVESEFFTFGPAWREDRGFRGELAMTGPVWFEGVGGWDASTSSARGAASSRAGFAARGETRAAWDLTVQSDAAYAGDYGPSFVDRGVAWRQSRLLLSAGPLRLLGQLPDDGSVGTLAQLRVRPELRGDGWLLAPSAAVGLRGTVSPAWDAASATAVGQLAAEARAAHTWPVLHLGGRALVAVDGPLDELAGVTFTEALSARAEVPVWVEAGDRRWQFFAGVRAADRGAALPFGELPGLGPSVRAETALDGTVLTGEAAVVWDGAWTPLASVQAAGADVVARAELAPTRQLLAIRTHGAVEVDAGVLFSADTAVAWADASLHVKRIVVGGGASRGLLADDAPSGVARLGYDDGCSALLLSAAFAPDRALPDFGVRLELRK